MLLSVVGLIFVVGGGLGIHQYRRLNRTGERVPGTVVGLRWRTRPAGPDGGSVRVCHPVLAFRTLDGRDIQAETGAGHSRVIAQPGEQVPVIYDPRNPAKAEINTRAGRPAWLPVIFVMAGVALICYDLFSATAGKA
jgi:uncharacterized protein DUF3592